MKNKNLDYLREKNIARQFARANRQSTRTEQKLKRQQEKTKKMSTFAESFSKERVEFINMRIDRIKEKSNLKVEAFKNQLKVLPTTPSPDEIAKIERSLLMRYYNLRLQIMAWSFSKKREKIEFKKQVAKLSDAKATELLTKVNINEGVASERWDKKIILLRDSTPAEKLKRKIVAEQTLCEKQVKSLIKRRDSVPANNKVEAVKDWWETIKSQYVFGRELRSIVNAVSANMRKYSMFYILTIIIFIFGSQTEWSNIKADNFVNIIQSNSYIFIIGLGMLLVIVSGCIDLSVGALLGFISALSVQVYNQTHQNIVLTLLLMILFGVGYGAFQGILIGYFKMPSFIVTLGGMLLFQGLLLWLTKGQTFTPDGNFKSSYVEFIQGHIPDGAVGDFHPLSFFIIFVGGILTSLSLLLARNKKIKYNIEVESGVIFLVKIGIIIGLFAFVADLIGTSLFGLKYFILYIELLIVLFMFLSQNTTFGRAIYAIGGNRKAAIVSGINAPRVILYVFMIQGAVTSFAAIVFAGIMTNAAPTAGVGYELDVISSVFVGGASMAGGIGSVTGTIIGGFVLGFINNGMSLMGLNLEIQKIAKAAVLILAVGYDVYSHRKIG